MCVCVCVCIGIAQCCDTCDDVSSPLSNISPCIIVTSAILAPIHFWIIAIVIVIHCQFPLFYSKSREFKLWTKLSRKLNWWIVNKSTLEMGNYDATIAVMVIPLVVVKKKRKDKKKWKDKFEKAIEKFFGFFLKCICG